MSEPVGAAELQQLLVRCLPAVEGYLRLRMGPALRAKESAADLAQSVAREALGDLPTVEFRGEAAFRNWLLARAQHKLQARVKWFRTQKRDLRREVELPRESRPELLSAYQALATPSRDLEIAEAVARIEAAFDELPEDWQEALALYKLGGLSHQQVAERMGRSEGAVRNLVYRALSRLALQLDVPPAAGA